MRSPDLNKALNRYQTKSGGKKHDFVIIIIPRNGVLLF